MLAKVPSGRVTIARVPGHDSSRVRARSSPTTQSATASALAVVAVVSMIALAVATITGTARADLPDPRIEQSLRAVEPALLSVARQNPGPWLVEGAADINSGGLAAGVVALLERAGYAAGFNEDFAWGIGTNHVITPDRHPTVLLTAMDDKIDQYRRDPQYHLIASYDSLSPADRAFVERTAALLASLWPRDITAIRRWAAQHPQESQRLADLNARSERAAIFATSLDATQRTRHNP